MAKTSVNEFIKQVKQETAKVTWPARKETTVSTVVVLVVAFVASLFFLLVDMGAYNIAQFFLKLGVK